MLKRILIPVDGSDTSIKTLAAGVRTTAKYHGYGSRRLPFERLCLAP